MPTRDACREFRRLVRIQLRDSEKGLSDSQQRSLARHLDDCGACAERYDRLLDQLDQLTKGISVNSRHREFEQLLAAYLDPREPSDPESSLGWLRASPEKPRYRIDEVLGNGGMGVVVRARDQKLGRDVAIKMILPQLRFESSLRDLFKKEVLALAQFNSPGVVTVHSCNEGFDYVSSTGTIAVPPFLVMELLTGETLQARVVKDSALKPTVIVDVMYGMASALVTIHEKKTVHRDLKPSNVQLIPPPPGTSEEFSVKILDLGLACLFNQSTNPNSKGLAGTPDFMAPEQFDKQRKHDASIDQFALGGVALFMALGHPPFRAADEHSLDIPVIIQRVCSSAPAALPNSFPPLLRKVIYQLLDKNPLKRFRSMEEVLGELDIVRKALKEGEGGSDDDVPPPPPPWLEIKWVAAIVSVFLVVTLAGAAWAIYRPPEQEWPVTGIVTPAEWDSAQGKIAEPMTNATVTGAPIPASGTLDELSADLHAWVAVKKNNLLYPKEPELTANRRAGEHWSVPVHEGGPSGQLDIVLLIVGLEGQETIQHWFEVQDFSGLDPAEIHPRELDSVSVTYQRADGN